MAKVDLAPKSVSFGKWDSVLTENPSHMIYVSEKCVVGTMAIMDSIFICLCGSNVFMPKYGAGIYWDDKIIGIAWPDTDKVKKGQLFMSSGGMEAMGHALPAAIGGILRKIMFPFVYVEMEVILLLILYVLLEPMELETAQ